MNRLLLLATIGQRMANGQSLGHAIRDAVLRERRT